MILGETTIQLIPTVKFVDIEMLEALLLIIGFTTNEIIFRRI
jgi:hypothetical protein